VTASGMVRSCQFKMTSDQVMPGQGMSHRIRSSQEISVQLKSESGQVSSAYVKLDQDKFRAGKMRSGRVKSGEDKINSGQIRSF